MHLKIVGISVILLLMQMPLHAQSLFSTDFDTTRTRTIIPSFQQEESLKLPNWQIRPERYPHLRSPQIKDPETMLLNWQWSVDYLRKRRTDPQAVAWAEMNRLFLDYLERERYKNMNPVDKLRMRLGAFTPVFDALAILVGMQMGALRGYAFGDQFTLQVAPRSLYASDTMEERFRSNAFADPELMALYKQFLRMEQTAWTRPSTAMPATLD
jgi:hypothetical protein